MIVWLQAELLTGMEVNDVSSARQAAEELQTKGCKTVIVTLGAQGSVLKYGNTPGLHVPTTPVTAVDTTVSTHFCKKIMNNKSADFFLQEIGNNKSADFFLHKVMNDKSAFFLQKVMNNKSADFFSAKDN
jgi:hypothetical protein